MCDSDTPNWSSSASLSRRRVLATGAAGLASALGGCAGGRSGGGRVPADVSSWPPDPDGSTLVMQNWYEDWVDWAGAEFSPGRDVALRNYGHPLEWEHRERP